MRHPTRALCAVLLLAPLSGCGGESAYVKEIDAWHAARVDRLRSPDGWLSLVGLHPLAQGPNIIGSGDDAGVRFGGTAPERVGVLEVGDRCIFFARPGAEVKRADGTPAGRITMLTDMQDDTTVIEVGTLSFFVIERGGARYLRVKDTDSTTRVGFSGIDRFPVDETWRVTARLVRHDPPRTVSVPNALGQVTEETSPGLLFFELDGEPYSLTPTGEPGEDLSIVFADATTGGATYDGGRFLSADPPDEHGEVVLDFNMAYNPPCAFTPYATCPRPPEGNTLAVAVTAGEKTWGEH